uniref:Cytochrome c oxidase subunit 2 n=1 Tax=Cyanidiococcus yangmingshanensis TaxID=2690220 RepID=A0A7H0WBE3_9RHOD|nr:cytochrome c oxidase subunit 2 [Cyanidiococcus yangmingshanensis]UNJ18956.1 cytochrome c oxidase subunit 2 [Cyanidioschyzonaceae sp. 2 FvB-2021]
MKKFSIIIFLLYCNIIICGKVYNDAPISWQIGFQDPATPVIEGIINLHHDLIFFFVLIFVFVVWILMRAIYLFNFDNNKVAINYSHGTLIELIWTVVPILILILIAVPSFALLYSIDEIINPAVTVKAVGHQWYWSYEYSDYITDAGEVINFDSYMIPEEDLQNGQLRLLEVDNRMVIPVNTHVRIIVTSADVIHSWAVPSLGVKCDGIPGRLNQISLFIKREGVYYGQCSELCGVNHGFMPIVVEAVSLNNYVDWIQKKLYN